MAKQLEVFIAFDKENSVLLKELEKHLRSLEMEGLITVWNASKITGGMDWQKEISKHLSTASIILLLVSSNFMASDEAFDLARRRLLLLTPIRVGEYDLDALLIPPARYNLVGLNEQEAHKVIHDLVDMYLTGSDYLQKINRGVVHTMAEKPVFPGVLLRTQNVRVWPTFEEYNNALKDALNTVYDVDVRVGILPRYNTMLRLSRSRGYVSVYKLGEWVVKCFITNPRAGKLIGPPPDIKERYQAINDYIALHQQELSFLVPQIWVERAIRINGQEWPFVKSSFIQAPTLGEFLANRYADSLAVAALAEQWLAIINTFEVLNMAHGDLEITNVLVVGTYPRISLRLVDFDCMYVPALHGRIMPEYGHEHFQAPLQLDVRHFNAEMDRFSALVIYLSLIALAEDERLWDQCKANEETKLLLGSEDFQDLSNSSAYNLLRSKQNNRELQLCLDELASSISHARKPRSLRDVLQMKQRTERPSLYEQPIEQSWGSQVSGGSYSENFTRQKRGLLVFLIDQSGSMQEPAILQGYKLTLAQMAASILNSLLVTVIENGALDTSTGRRKDYCDIVVFGYGDSVVPLLNPSGVPVPLPDLAENPREMQTVRMTKYDRLKGNYVTVDEKQPYWIEPSQTNNQRTAMAQAISAAQQSVQNWLNADTRRQASFPPIVINITGGSNNRARGDDPVQETMKLRQLRTDDGAVLLFNCYITKSSKVTLSFPRDLAQIKSLNLSQEEYVGAEQLFQMSSEIPATMRRRAQDLSGTSISRGARGFIYNASGEDLVRFLSWGTLVNAEYYG